MKARQIKSNLMLMLTALIWGAAFVAQSVSMDYVGQRSHSMRPDFLLAGWY